MAKRIGLWLNRVFDTADDYGLLHALPKFPEVLCEMSPVIWQLYVRVSTSPIPQADWDVDDAIHDKRLGSIGEFFLPQDVCDSVVPDFSSDGLRDINMDESWGDRDMVLKGASRLVS